MLVVGFLLVGFDAKDNRANLGVDTGARDLLEDSRFLVFVALEEHGELALREKGGAAELSKVQSNDGLYLCLHLSVVIVVIAADEQGFGAWFYSMQGPYGIAHLCANLLECTSLYGPFSFIGMSVVALEL